MRNLILALLTATASAQSPLTTTFANDGNLWPGGNIYFDLDVTEPAGITIASLDINATMPAWGPAVEIYTVPGGWVGNWNDAAAWTLQATADAESAGAEWSLGS